MVKGYCLFCREAIGFRKRTHLLLKHSIWVSGRGMTCPGSGQYANSAPDADAQVGSLLQEEKGGEREKER